MCFHSKQGENASFSLCFYNFISKQNKKVGILHFDAHTDLLDTRLGIDLCFGSWAYHILEDLSSPELLVQVGIRSSAKDRMHWEKKFGVTQIWANEVIETPLEETIRKILDIYKNKNVDDSNYNDSTAIIR